MTAQFLTTELGTLIQESKRRNPDLRSAAEKSLDDLRALPSTSEAQLAAGLLLKSLGLADLADFERDLKRRPSFLRPFLLACGTRSPKFAGNAVSCLQRLILSKALSQETLKEVLEALRECSSLGLDIQLKVLQALPSLLQNFAGFLFGDLLSTALQVCFLLYGSKTAVVSNTAAATLQQFVVSVLEKVEVEDERGADKSFIAEAPIENGSVSVGRAAFDAYRLLNDLCLSTEGQKPEFLQITSLSQTFGLELIESMLSNNVDTVSAHPELINILRIRLMPFIIRVLSERASFSTTVRTMRLIPMILGHLISVLSSECEMVLSLLNHMLDPDAAMPWKRVLCMEVFRAVHADPALFRNIYSSFDEQDGRRNIVRDHMAILVRLATEKPAIIGLGQQSTIPAVLVQSQDDSDQLAAVQAEGIAGTIGLAVNTKASNAPGISMQLSIPRVSCMEQLDKADAPYVPAAYIYSLVLTCINTFSESLARFLMPFSIPSDNRGKRKLRQSKNEEAKTGASEAQDDSHSSSERKKYRQRSQSLRGFKSPINPLSLDTHVLYSQIRTSAAMVETCWPALLAACSTFFNAALDQSFYHSLVRSFQKFTQVAGLLRLSTPRDAFLTTLGKNAVPPSVASAHTIASSVSALTDVQDRQRRARSSERRENDPSPSPNTGSDRGRTSLDLAIARLSARNMLCLRALLNLGIALGPVLQGAWSIIFETLQQADLIVAQSASLRRQKTGSNNNRRESTPVEDAVDDDLGVEISAVETATNRLLESSSDTTDDAFRDMILGLSSLLHGANDQRRAGNETPVNGTLSPNQKPQHHRRISSMSGAVLGVTTNVRGDSFVVQKIGELATFNIPRLIQKDVTQSGWDLMEKTLISVLISQENASELRVQAAETLHNLVVATTTSAVPTSLEVQDDVRRRGLELLSRITATLHSKGGVDTKASQSCENDIHRLTLGALRSVLEQYGDSLVRGWDIVFAIIASVFNNQELNDPTKVISNQYSRLDNFSTVSSRSQKLVRSAFGPLQLICSDFLSSVPKTCFMTLLDTIYSFCAQQEDFNISLTSTTFFWNVSDYLWQEHETLHFENFIYQALNELALEVEIESHSKSSDVALWLNLLLKVVAMTTDSRLEVRHSALYTIFRILDACGDSLDPDDWNVCLKYIISKILSGNQARFEEEGTSSTKEERPGSSEWNETAIVMLNGISRLFEQHLQIIGTHPDFSQWWVQLERCLLELLGRHSLKVSAAVFNLLTKALSEIGDSKAYMTAPISSTWNIWKDRNPVSHTDDISGPMNGNQDALLAYLQCLRQIHHLTAEEIQLDQIREILSQLHTCVRGSNTSAYTADNNSLTPIQNEALDSIKTIRTDIAGAPTELIKAISSLVAIAYDEDETASINKGLTYVALSKRAMDILESYIAEHIDDQDVHKSGVLINVLETLVVPIRLKYKRGEEGKEPPTWKKATTAAVSILQISIPKVLQFQAAYLDLSTFWEGVVWICGAVTSASYDSAKLPPNLSCDQEFDINAFTSLRDLVTPALGVAKISDKVCRQYTEWLFKNSIIHDPHPDDLPKHGQEPLAGLQSIHIGRTQNLPPTHRSKMSYVLLDETFNLVAVHDGTPERVRLAQAAAPFLILRVGIALKAYSLDRPLRGRMPQPMSEKRELLHILQKLALLDSEPKSIPDAPGVVSEHKKHLHRLYPIVAKALGVAWRDDETQRALTRIIEIVGEDFGV